MLESRSTALRSIDTEAKANSTISLNVLSGTLRSSANLSHFPPDGNPATLDLQGGCGVVFFAFGVEEIADGVAWHHTLFNDQWDQYLYPSETST